MKPIKLCLEGIKSFATMQVVDFTCLTQSNLFGITGATRSGKSTILDGIIIALYGDTSGRSKARKFINLKCDRMVLELEFEIVIASKRKRFVVRRVFKKKSNTAEAFLSEVVEGELVPVISGTEKVNAEIEQMLGINKSNFAQVVIMEQGEFAKFLNMSANERNSMIGKIFDLERFGEPLYNKTSARCDQLKNEIDVLTAEIDTLDAPTQEQLKETAKQVKQLTNQLVQAEAGYAEATTAAEGYISALRVRQSELEQITKNRELLQLQQKEIVRLREEYREHLKELNKCEKSIAEIDEDIKAQEDIKSRSLKVLHPATTREQAQELLAELTTKEAERVRLTAENAKLQAEQEQICKTVKGISVTLIDLLEQEKRFKQQAEQLQNQISALELKAGEVAQSVGKILPHLHVGDACPVCGGTVSEIAPKNIAENDVEAYSSARNLLAGIKTRLEEIAVVAPSQGLKIDELNKREQSIAKQVEENDKKIANFSTVNLVSFKEAFRQFGNAIDKISSQEIVRARLAGEVQTTQEKMLSVEVQGKKIDELIKQLRLGQDVNAEQELAEVKSKIEGFDKNELYLARQTLERQCKELSARLAITKTLQVDGEAKREKSKDKEKHRTQAVKKYDVAMQLLKAIRSKALLEYVADEYIQSFTYNANQVLAELSLSDYRLVYVESSKVMDTSKADKRVFAVIDNNNGGHLRGVETLSGGETFLVSLALNIAIGKEISTSRQFEFFFIDEGFGTLDNELIDVVLKSIQRLKSPYFNIGLITHRAELMRQLPVRLCVTRGDNGSVVCVGED